MKKSFLTVLLFTFALILSADERVKYVFLIIGDGFGVNQRFVTETLEKRKLEISKLPVSALTGTLNAFSSVTDSAASGTAIACGEKTYNSSIGLDVNGRPLVSIARRLQSRGFSIGIISSSHLTDATLAAQYANQAKRSMYDEIGVEMSKSAFDFFGGADVLGSKTLEHLKNASYCVITEKELTPEALSAKKLYLRSMPYTSWDSHEEQGARLSLADYTRISAEKLSSNPNGFFILVENGMTDKAGHANDIAWAYREVLALNEAYLAAHAFAEKHPGETLIIVTADHETGGLEIRENFDPAKLALLRAQKAKSPAIADMVREMLAKKTPASSVTDSLQTLIGLDSAPFTPEERAKLEKELNKEKPSATKLVLAAMKIRDSRIGLEYTTSGHSDKKIWTNVEGAGSELFCAPLENADIYHLIYRAVLGEDASERQYAVERTARVAEYKVTLPYREKSKKTGDITFSALADGTFTSVADGKKFTLDYPDISGQVAFEVFKGTDFYLVDFENKSRETAFFVYPKLKAKVFGNGTWCVFKPSAQGAFYVYDAERPNWKGSELADFRFLIRPGEKSSFLISRKAQPLADGKTPRLITVAESSAAYNAFPKSVPLHLSVPSIDAAPVIDGVADEAVWRNIEPVKLVGASSKKVAAQNITVRTAVDSACRNMYIFADIEDSEITSQERKRDEAVYDDDALELFLGSYGHKTYYHVIVNPSGSVYDARSGAKDWNAGFTSKTVRTPKGWSLEMAIPLSQFDFKAMLSQHLFHG